MASLLRYSLRSRPAARLSASRSLSSSLSRNGAAPEHRYFPDEPQSPIVQTTVPGPKSKAAAAELNQVYDIRSLNLFGDYERSIGN